MSNFKMNVIVLNQYRQFQQLITNMKFEIHHFVKYLSKGRRFSEGTALLYKILAI